MTMWSDWHDWKSPINPNGIFLIQAPWIYFSNIIQGLVRATWDLMYDDGGPIYYDKAMYIRLMIHFLGDIHAPSHCADFYNATEQDPNGDDNDNFYKFDFNMNISSMGPVNNYFDGWN